MMKQLNLFLLIASSLLLTAACDDNTDPKDDPTTPETVKYAPDLYWAPGYSGAQGIQMGEIEAKPGEPRMILAGVPLYVTGVNCYNLFVQCHESDNMNTYQMEAAVKTLAKEECPIVRFSCSPFYATQMHFYTEEKTKYLANLDKLADLCDQYKILLIPSIFWNSSCLPTYFEEELKAWGSKDSETYKFMIEYTTEIVNVLKGHKCLAAWEFGNEFNLQADISSAGYPELSAGDVNTAYKGFAETVSKLDTENRMISSGNSIMRNAQYHLWHYGSWNNDSFNEYKEISGIFNPKPMTGMSEHIYEEDRVFSDKGKVSRKYQVSYAKQAAAQNGCAYYVGEFTGPSTAAGDSLKVKAHYTVYLAEQVQLSMIWNYALYGNIEYSFKADTEYGNMAFGYMRAFNKRYAQMKPEK